MDPIPPPLVHKLESGKTYNKILAFAVLIVITGVFSGYYLFNRISPQLTSDIGNGRTDQTEAVTALDGKTFKDSAEGELVAGGVDGEGTHQLKRPGGESQTVALTSSVLDLSKFEGKKVKVWGETFAAQTAGWLMDVGKVEVLR